MFSSCEKRYKTYNWNLFLSGRQTKPDINTSILLKKIAMAITFHLPPWLPLCLKWLRCYHNNRAEKTLVNFTPIECLAVHHVNPLSKICQKCPCTVTETIQQPLQLQSLPGWHTKNTGLSYLFCKMFTSISGLVWRLVRFKSQFNGLSHFSDAENKHCPCSWFWRPYPLS